MRAARRLTVPATVLGLALAATACAPPKTKTAPTTTTVAVPTTTTRPAAPSGTPVPSGFLAGSVTFVSTTTGYVLGVDSSCSAGSCVALARTTDGGSSWVAVPAPPGGYVAQGDRTPSTLPAVSEVRFADELDGWIYGPSLFATHDGGATWSQVSLGGSVIALETSGGWVDAVVSPCSAEEVCSGPLALYQAPATGGPFALVLSGPSTQSAGGDSFHLSLHAPVGFVNMAGVAEAGQAAFFATENLAEPSGWKAFPDPCALSPGSSVDAFVAPDTTTLVTLCSGQAAAGSVAKEVVRTQNARSTVVGTPPSGGEPEGLAATSSGTVVVAAASGASWLYRSTDGGATWTTAATFNDGGVGFNDLGFTTATQGVVIHGLPGPPADYASQLLMTTDGGATWRAVPIG